MILKNHGGMWLNVIQISFQRVDQSAVIHLNLESSGLANQEDAMAEGGEWAE